MDDGTDALSVVKDILQVDASLMDYIKDKKKSLNNVKSLGLHPEAYITATCSNLINDMDGVESELSEYTSSIQSAHNQTSRISALKPNYQSTSARFDKMLANFEQERKNDSLILNKSRRGNYDDFESQTSLRRATPVDDAVFNDRFKIHLNESPKSNSILSITQSPDFDSQRLLEKTKSQLINDNRKMLAYLEKELHERQQKEMNKILLEHESLLELEIQRLHDKYAIESKARRAALYTQLEKEKRVAIQEIDDEFLCDEANVETKARQLLQMEIVNLRQDKATALLKMHEETLGRLRKEMLEKSTIETQQELTKLKEALNKGSELRLTQLREELEHVKKIKLKEVEDRAKIALDDESSRLSCEHATQLSEKVHALETRLREHHRFEIRQLEQQLAIEETRVLNDLTIKMHEVHNIKINEVEEQHSRQSRQRLHELQLGYENEFHSRVDTLKASLDQQLETELRAHLSKHQTDLADALDNTKVQFIQHLERLRREWSYVFNCTKPLPSVQSPTKDVGKWIDNVANEFAQISSQNATLVETVDRLSKQLLALKVKNQRNHDSEEINHIRVELDERNQIIKQLYHANESLLKRVQ
ncbi:hypothetical protein THRCLA_21584, partial [Thraustotheca clavata]